MQRGLGQLEVSGGTCLCCAECALARKGRRREGGNTGLCGVERSGQSVCQENKIAHTAWQWISYWICKCGYLKYVVLYDIKSLGDC